MTHLIFPKNKTRTRMFVLFFFIRTLDIFYYRGIVVSIRRRGHFSDETHFLLPLHPSFAFVPPNVNVLIVSPQSISLWPLRPPPQKSNIVSFFSLRSTAKGFVYPLRQSSKAAAGRPFILAPVVLQRCLSALTGAPPLARANGENHATGVHPSTKDRRLKKDMIRLHLMALVSRGR
jgi:hypothetical protein